MVSNTSSCDEFITDIGSILDTCIYNLPKWIGRQRKEKILQLSRDIYSKYGLSKDLKKIKPFNKVIRVILRNLETKICYPNAAYYLIKTFHFLHIYINHLPNLTGQLIIGGNNSFFSKLVLQINMILAQFKYSSKVNSLLFHGTISENSKYYPLSEAAIIASVMYEYLKLSNAIVRELYFCKLCADEFSQLDNATYAKFITAFSRISPLKLLIASYGLNEFHYDEQNPHIEVQYTKEMYADLVAKTTLTTLFPPPPAYELRIMLLEFLDSAIKLAGWDSALKNKCVWVVKTPLCKVNNGQVKVYNKDVVQTKISFNCKSNLSRLIVLSISLIDADALTINCNSMRYFYGEYYLSLPSTITERDGTVSTLSLGSRLTIDPKLASFIVYKMQSISLNILSQLDQIPVQSISNTLYDKLVNLAWYYGTAFPDNNLLEKNIREKDLLEENLLEPNIGFNTCCGGSEKGIKCGYISTYDVISSLKLISQSVKVVNNPHPTESDFIHMDLIETKIENEFPTLQDRVEYSVDKDFWIVNNTICKDYIAPTIKIKTGPQVTYTSPKTTPCECNMFCIYNKHIYNNISWICSRGITMPGNFRKKLVIKALEIMLQNNDSDVANAPLVNGFNIAKLINNRSKFLLKSLTTIFNELKNVDEHSTLDDQTLLLYSEALSQIL